MMSLHQLSKETVHLLSSSQVVTSICSVVKELVENSIDAKATSIEVKLENFGLNLIEVRDNGTGIKREDTANMAKPHFTSKLITFNDLQSLEHYGFRGEALSSVAAVSNMTVTTRTNDDIIATTYTLDHSGTITSSKHSHLSTGTTVSVVNIFRNLPVRRQCFKSAKKCKEELRRIEELLIGFGLAHCGLRLTLKHNKCVVWQKIQTADFGSNVSLIFGAALFQQLLAVNYQCFSPMVKIRAFVPKPESDLSLVSRSTPDKIYLLVNERCVVLKQLIQLLKQTFSEAFPSQSGRYPVAMVTISVPPGDIDVNLEPNKSSVLLQNMDFILTTMESLLTKVYSPCKISTAGKEAETTAGRTVGAEREVMASTTSRTRSSDTETRDTVAREQEVMAPPTSREAPPTKSMDFIYEKGRAPSFQGRLSGEVCRDQSVRTGCKLNDVVAARCRGNLSEPDPGSPQSKGQRSSNVADNDSDLIIHQELESLELLDISEFENDSCDSLPDKTLETPNAVSNMSSPARETNGSIVQFNQMSLSQWSRGEGLRDCVGRPLEPVKLLTSGAHEESTGREFTTVSHTPKQIHVSSQSKLTYKGPPPIFDMIHSKPVKRKADSSPSASEDSTGTKKHRPLPALLQNLVHQQNNGSMSASCSDEVDGSKPVVSVQNLSFDFESISRRNDTNYSGSKQTQDCVIGYVDPPGLWLVLVDGSIACINTNTSSLNSHSPNSLGPTDRKEVEQLLHGHMTSSDTGYKDNSRHNDCFHKLITL